MSVRTWAVLHHRLRLADKTPQEAATAILLRGLMELCIYGAAPAPLRGRGPDGGPDGDGEHLPVPWSCADNALLQVSAREGEQVLGRLGTGEGAFRDRPSHCTAAGWRSCKACRRLGASWKRMDSMWLISREKRGWCQRPSNVIVPSSSSTAML